MTAFSPLRYPGGKGRLADFIREVVETNNMPDLHYIEPFAGGAGVGLELLLMECVRHIHINDIDISIYAFWHSVLNHTEEFCRLIRDYPVTIESWRDQKEIRQNPESYSLLQLGFATFFLNRTNRSGVLNAGPIGGINQLGAWAIDCRYNRNQLIERVQRISLFGSRVSIANMDAIAFIESKKSTAKSGSLVYLDPPYFNKGAYLYRNHFTKKDHETLARFVRGITNFRWIVSYDNVEDIKAIYSGEQQEEFNIVYSANGYSQGREIMIFDERIVRPSLVYTSKRQREQNLSLFGEHCQPRTIGEGLHREL